jgi:hypothetical protein
MNVSSQNDDIFLKKSKFFKKYAVCGAFVTEKMEENVARPPKYAEYHLYSKKRKKK